MDLPKNVIAFDCDGTISLSGGNVTPEQLAILASHGNIVVIVSPSGACVSLHE
jgi:hydroxymethylpyrimidine pyrophosphatase-like HAD family hydrolase